REQSAGRQTLEFEAWDEANGLIKINPLAEWTSDDVWAYIKTYGVPNNALHDRGYPSIGCAPCTRAVEPGEDSRAGRWWWESSSETVLRRRSEYGSSFIVTRMASRPALTRSNSASRDAAAS